MNSVLYNNMYQIVQTEDYVMILVGNGARCSRCPDQW